MCVYGMKHENTFYMCVWHEASCNREHILYVCMTWSIMYREHMLYEASYIENTFYTCVWDMRGTRSVGMTWSIMFREHILYMHREHILHVSMRGTRSSRMTWSFNEKSVCSICGGGYMHAIWGGYMKSQRKRACFTAINVLSVKKAFSLNMCSIYGGGYMHAVWGGGYMHAIWEESLFHSNQCVICKESVYL